MLVFGVRRRVGDVPPPATMTMFIAACVTMLGSLLPDIVPFSMTLREAAASPASLAFVFWGAGLVVLLVTLVHTAIVYWVFRGKMRPSSDPDDDDDASPANQTAAAAAQVRAASARAVMALRTRMRGESPIALAGDIAGRAAAHACTLKGLAVLTLMLGVLLRTRQPSAGACR